MYVLIVYDVEVGRVVKVHRFLKRYLDWVQNSVFEGEIGEADFKIIKKRLSEIVDKDFDSVLIFRIPNVNAISKEVIGQERNITDTIL